MSIDSDQDVLNQQLLRRVAELEAALKRSPARRWRAGGARSRRWLPMLCVGLLVGVAGLGGVGYASVAVTPTASPGAYKALAPVRILDTIYPLGAPGPVAAGGTVSLLVSGSNGVPADATAVVINVTAAQGTKAGSITVYPDGTTRPNASNLNYVPGQTVPNLVTATLGSDGKVDFYNSSGGTVQLIADLAGYYAPITATSLSAAGSTSGQILTSTGTGVSWQTPPFQAAFTNTVVVPSGGSSTANGTALQDAVGAFASDNTVPTLILLEPGTYFLSNSLVLPDNTWIEGAGQAATTIQSSGATDGIAIETGGNGPYGLADLNLLAAETYGIYASASMEIDNVAVTTYTQGGSDLVASGAGTIVTVTDSTLTSSYASTVTALTTAAEAYFATLVVDDSTITAAAGYALASNNGHTTARGSVITTTTGHSMYNNGTIDVASSQVVGPIDNASGVVTCVGAYNATFAALGSACT